MRNASVKFEALAALLSGQQPVPHAFDGMDPLAMLRHCKALLDEADQGTVLFGFSEPALMAIMAEELEVDMDTGRLTFRKFTLDARSIALAGLPAPDSRETLLITPRENRLIEQFAAWLFEITRPLYRSCIDEARIADIQLEYSECMRQYAAKKVAPYEPDGVSCLLRSIKTSPRSLSAFMHALTVDAMFKADAARVLFGEESAYAQAWFRKQVFRHKMSKAADALWNRCTA